MATITSVGTGAWSASGTWDSGVPVDGDDVVIASGHTVTFDVDQSTFVTGVKVTITGTLTHTTVTGTYCLFIKTGASVVGAGTWNIGTEATPIPFAAKHTITGASGWYVSGSSGLTMTVYGAEPTNTYVRLSGAEALGQTALSVDTDVTGDIWADGDTIAVADIDKAKEVEKYTIAAGGIAAGEITVTVGLSNAKLEGAYVVLVTRNINIIAVGAHPIDSVNDLTIGGGQFTSTSSYRMLYRCNNVSISGGAFHGGYSALSNSLDFIISGGVFTDILYPIYSTSSGTISDCLMTGCGYISFTNCYGITIDSGIFAGLDNGFECYALTILGGTFHGNQYAIRGGYGNVFGGTFESNANGVYQSMVTIKGATFTSNNCDIRYSQFTAYNVLLGSATEVGDYGKLSTETCSESIDHDQVAGAYKAWTKGGVTTKQAVTYPTGFTNSMQTVLESATSEGYWQKEISVGAGQSVNITSYLRKDASMTYLPRVIMFLKNTTDPFAGGTGLHTFTMTDSIDTWEDDTYTYSNDTSEDVVLVIRTQGKNATGNLFSYLDIEVINVDLTSVLALLNTIDGIVNDILADTVLLSDGVTLADDAITSAKFDESTAYPLKSADTGATAIARVGADSDTLETLSDEIAAVKAETALIVEDTGTTLSNLITAIKSKTDLMDASAITYTPNVVGTDITLLRGDTFSATLTDVGALTGYVSIDFTVKRNTSNTDDEAVIRIRKNASGTGDGLLRLNRAAPTTETGEIVIDDEATGDITITLDETATDSLEIGAYLYDVQLITATAVKTLTSGRLNVTSDVTRAIA